MLLRPTGSRAIAVLASLVLFSGVAAQQRRLTVEDIYGYAGWARFNGNQFAAMSWVPRGGPWLDATHHLWPSPDASASSWLRVDAVTGQSEPLYTIEQLESALLKAGVSQGDARAAARRRPANFNSRRDRCVLAIDDTLYLYDLPSGAAKRLTNSAGAKSEVTFSPNGDLVAFINDNNLFVAGIDSSAESALTRDGSPALLNGKLDWVYSEELYGRGNHRGYWWSPDSSRIVFLQLDESPVPEYTLVDDIDYHPTIDRWDYPKAGDPNPQARLGVVTVAGGPVRWIDTSAYRDFLLVNAGWAPNNTVVFQVQNRQQSWLELNRANPDTGVSTRLLREEADTWVERWQDDSADPVWLADGSFLWLSERSGWRHLYHYTASGSLIRQVTSGDWEVHAIEGVDPAGSWIYFRSTAAGPTTLQLHRIRMDGANLQSLSQSIGHHRSFLNPTRTLFLDSWSDIHTPPQVRVHRADSGAPIRVVEANEVAALKEHRFSRPELLQIKARDGFVMEAMMIKPPDFEATKRYPVYQFTYAGPHSPQVLNRWGGLDGIYYQLLAQHGVIVWVCDNRTASGKGARSAWPLYKNVGVTELRDLEDGVAWLKQQPYVDGSRIGLSGWSYGGFMTLYALTHSKSFAMGIAGGALSDWRNYDTIYTERYMGLPKDNENGYRQSSPRFSAANLHGQLLLIHGAMDDNVHPQNATQFARELQRSGKQFQMMVYPKSAHGISEPELASHLHQLMLDFTVQNLLR